MRFYSLVFLTISTLFINLTHAQVLNWSKNSQLNSGLPPSVEVYSFTGNISGNVPLKAWYMVIDTKDPNIEFKPVGNGGSNKTLSQYVAQETDPVYGCINGGFFTGNSSLSLVLQNNAVLSPNVKQLTRLFNGVNTSYFPTRGAFGIDSLNQMDVAWMYNVGATNVTYAYPNPSLNQLNFAPMPVPSDTFPAGAYLWRRRNAIGGSPVLISNDSIRITASEELIDVNNAAREPRTAIGYTADGKMILFVAEGRNPSVSEGLSLAEVAQIMKSIGCREALNLDGGGSTGMIANGVFVNRPSDGGNQRPVASAVVIKRANLVFDTEMSNSYRERGAGWSTTSQAGFYPPSQARICQTTNTNSSASYYFSGINPGRYEVSAWWPVATNRAINTPFTLYRNGVADTVTIRLNQSTAGGGANRFNVIGTFDISANDSLVVSTAGATGSGAAPYFITTDAVRLIKVGESNLQIQLNPQLSTVEVIKDSSLQFNLQFISPNTGFRVNKYRVFRTLGTNTETQIKADSNLGNVYNVTLPYTFIANSGVGSVTLRFEIEDNLGRKVSRSLAIQVVPLTQLIIEGANNRRTQFDRDITIKYTVNSRRSNVNVTEVNIFRKIGLTGQETLLVGPIAVNKVQDSLQLTRKVNEPVNSDVFLRFEAKDQNQETFSRTMQYRVEPKRGDFRLIAVSDFNSSFGSVTYEYQVDSIFQRIPRMWMPDMVICGGDMVAGQSATLDSTQVANMWNAFDQKVALPLRNANIPFAFTMGNHDASASILQDRLRSKEYWNSPGRFPGWFPVDTSNYPYYSSFMEKDSGNVFIVSWDASDANLSAAEVDWARTQLLSARAKAAKWRIVVGHMPLYGVAAERDGPGNILSNAENLRNMFEETNVTAYVAGHHHAYFPGKRGNIELLNAGAIGSGPRQWLTLAETSPNTATIMDFFGQEDTIVYTTFEIRHQKAEDMQVFDEKRLPSIVSGFNGYTLNRFVQVNGNATGIFSSFNNPIGKNGNATGTANVKLENGKLIIDGSFNNLSGRVASSRTAISLYRGLHAQAGSLLLPLQVFSTDGKNGTFLGELVSSTQHLELLSSGAYFIKIDTDSFPDGEVRTQLYKLENKSADTSKITTFAPDVINYVRDIPGLLVVNWTTPKDPEVNPLTYIYQISNSPTFSNLLYEEGTGRFAEVRKTQSFWYNLLGTVADSVSVNLYHRVISTDGRNVVQGATQLFTLAKTKAPVEGSIEIPAPEFVYDCTQGLDVQDECIGAFGRTPANNGQGLTRDGQGKIWASSFSFGFTVFNPNSSPYTLTHPGLFYRTSTTAGINPYVDSILIGNFRDRVSNVTGMGRAHDGNILLAANNRVYKLDQTTGQPLARIQLPTSLTNPESDTLGNIFVTSVTGNNSWLLRQNGLTFDTIRINLVQRPSGSITRAASISPNGRELYIPYLAVNGRSTIQKYSLVSPNNFTLASEFSAQGACKSIYTQQPGIYYAAYDASGPLPARVICRDERDTSQILSWTYAMPSINGQDLRGIVFAMSGDTFYTVSTTVGRVERHIKKASVIGENPEEKNVVPHYTIREVKKTDTQGRADSANVYCRLSGVVNSRNLVRNGNEFSLVDGHAGIQVEASSISFEPIMGDSIRVSGRIIQEFGVIKIEADTIVKLGVASLIAPQVLQKLSDTLESTTTFLPKALLADTLGWTSGIGYHGFNSKVAYGADTLSIFISSVSSLYNKPRPTGEIALRGIVSQFDIAIPFTGGYFIQLRDTNDLLFVKNASAPLANYCEGDSLSLSYQSFGEFNNGNQFVYELSDSNGSFNTATIVGSSNQRNNTLKYGIPLLAGSDQYRYRIASTNPPLAASGVQNVLKIYPKPRPIITFDSIVNQLAIDINDASYQWYLGGNMISGATGKTLQNPENGLYSIVVAKNGCSATSPNLEVKRKPIGIATNDVISKIVSVYPNPTSGQVTIEINHSYVGNISFSLYNTYGEQLRLIQADKTTAVFVKTIDISTLPQGSYILKIQVGEKYYAEKLLKY
jgi:hypothetical protein